jgi:hypothetical protein
VQATFRPGRFWLERPRRFFLLVLAAALLLALAGSAVRFLASTSGATRGAWWIWASGVEPIGQPIAFYAVGDFELDAVEPARIAIAADEGYELHVNGRPVGVGVYRPGTSIDRYRIDDLLRVGNNRLTVRLQSLRGHGGLLATVATAVEPERTLLVTSDGWRIFREHDPRLFDADADLPAGEPPQVWQRAPTGRWRLHPAAGDRPLLPPPGGDSARQALQVRDFYPEALWFDLRRPRKSPIRFLETLLDWEQEVAGLLSFELASPASEPALAYFGAEIPDPAARPADAVLLFVPGQTSWRDLRPRRFRYALLVGVEPIDRVSVQELEPGTAVPFPADGPPAGVWGIRPPPRSDKLQESVWQRIQALAEERAHPAGR